jgi:putative ABC transport system substrate-binding protein
MIRRQFITLLGGAAAWPLAARAQPAGRIRRIGVLSAFAESDPEAQGNVTAFRQALEKLGWTDGGNVRIDYRWSHPGGNVTGFTLAEFSMYGKLLEVLKEIAPQVTRVAAVLNPDQTPQEGMWRAIEAAAPSFKTQLTAAGVRNATEIERAINAFALETNGGLIVLPNPVNSGNRKLIITMAAQHRLPAIYTFPFFVKDGGLISYGVDLGDQYQQAASYVDRVLRGEKPADLPVQAPTKYQLVINLKTAKALNLEVPPTLLARADEVIE